ncbi:type II toxin-antitoxin system RatA family toxin [Vitiosangium sp. GDMCC 1.1324]|uniref:type II toxin-antitoxin system RatA family toxin n=1 Tax=Vitiosangium sp. (strain GDMCC 1.1324) TaxID=2138576 RepID=UPI000D347CFE|nr:SRPBCC family protein [Vitiosangium sp. GDMCC 1.1324]PTL85234.1 cyclase [Vitiosangium sp. GDMCC 1.1324]
MAGATRSIVINAPPDKVFDIIINYDRYGDFLPEVKKVWTSDRKGNEVKVHYEVNVVKTIRYTILVREERPKRMSWSFVEGEVMKDNKGSWVLEPEGDNRTKATYTVEMALGPLVPKAIINGLVDQSLPKMLEAFKRRAESP